MSCDVGEVTERLENELWYDYNYELCSFSNLSFTSPTSLYLHRSSFSNPSAVSPTSQCILQPFFCFSYVTSSSLNSPGEPPMVYVTNKLWQILLYLHPHAALLIGQYNSVIILILILINIIDNCIIPVCYAGSEVACPPLVQQVWGSIPDMVKNFIMKFLTPGLSEVEMYNFWSLDCALRQGSSTFWVRGPIYIFHIILRAAVIADYRIIMNILNIITGA